MEAAIKLFIALKAIKLTSTTPYYFKNSTHFEEWCEVHSQDPTFFTVSRILVGLEYPDHSQGYSAPAVVCCGGGPKEFYNLSKGYFLLEKCTFERDVDLKKWNKELLGPEYQKVLQNKEQDKEQGKKQKEDDDDGDIMGGCDPLKWM